MPNGETNKDAAERLIKFIQYANENTKEEAKINAILNECGVSDEMIREKAMQLDKFIEDQITQYHSALVSRRVEMVDKILEAAKKILGRSDLNESDAEKLGLSPGMVAAFCRNLSGVTKKDKLSMSEDIELLEVLEKHLNQNK